MVTPRATRDSGQPLARSAPRRRLAPLLTLLIALNLSLLTPISYVVDYLLWQRPIALSDSGALCDIRQILPLINSAAGGMTRVDAPLAIQAILGQPVWMPIITGVVIALIALCSCTPPRRPACAPPTPPPRNSGVRGQGCALPH